MVIGSSDITISVEISITSVDAEGENNRYL